MGRCSCLVDRKTSHPWQSASQQFEIFYDRGSSGLKRDPKGPVSQHPETNYDGVYCGQGHSEHGAFQRGGVEVQEVCNEPLIMGIKMPKKTSVVRFRATGMTVCFHEKTR